MLDKVVSICIKYFDDSSARSKFFVFLLRVNRCSIINIQCNISYTPNIHLSWFPGVQCVAFQWNSVLHISGLFQSNQYLFIDISVMVSHIFTSSHNSLFFPHRCTPTWWSTTRVWPSLAARSGSSSCYAWWTTSWPSRRRPCGDFCTSQCHAW